ncbi:type III PLP-dependent enzyme domain-containing protein [Actinoplanes awajinensis]|uniref:Decarboxylase n=1 Tax=Actinoplanes awajinensis subsp. mycoplanecinus TaxID=135947 RepID=A0A101JFA8_9ACTN|nr:hypothetical protein [Actinoplanes awajinensis]KUL25803.1 hypothetical protein ADL15_39520 [Actinoplanes awajinensis subsp. mycoplanecinus]
MPPPFDPEDQETPAYVYDVRRVRTAHERLVASLPSPTTLLYSLKANPHPAVLRELARAGCRAEVSSPGELGAALHAGFHAGDVLYTGPGKRDRDLHTAVEAGVRWFSLDSAAAFVQLEAIAGRHAQPVSALLRVNPPRRPPGAGLAMTGGVSQFGVEPTEVRDRPGSFADRPHVRLAGLHLYLGSNIAEEDALITVFGYALDVAEEIQTALARRLPVLDLGGGFGAPYARRGPLPTFATLRQRLEELFDRRVPAWRTGEQRIVFESGRYLTATCGTLLTRVLDVKRTQGRRILVLDSGVHHLGGMSGLGKEDGIEPELVTAERAGELHEHIVSGPLCHPLDRWSHSAKLPAMRTGDLVAVPNVGAYGLHSSLALFHGHPLPVEIVVDDGAELERTRIVVGREDA